MPAKTGRLLAALALLTTLMLLLSSPLAARPGSAGAPRPDGVRIPSNSTLTTASDAALAKLSPDLRGAAETPDSAVRLVVALIRPGAAAAKYMERSATSRRLGDVQWVTGEVRAANLLKLASLAGVLSVTSTETYQPLPAPGLDELRGTPAGLSRARIAELVDQGGKAAVAAEIQARGVALPSAIPQRQAPAGPAPRADDSVKVVDIHRADEAHAAGYTGAGVIAAVIDSGVDFGHPDLQGTQARVSGGVYDGWPFAYDTFSGINYALADLTIGPDNFWAAAGGSLYAHTLPVDDADCDDVTGICSAELMIDFGSLAGFPWPPVTLEFQWPHTSQSGDYYYSVYPDPNHFSIGAGLGLGYAATDLAPAALILADETTAGVYDTVYVDADFDQDLTGDKPMSKGDELAGADIFDATLAPGSDGMWDLSVSMLTWIADGVNPPPGVGVIYEDVAVPDAGRLVTFVGDAQTHGTNVAGMIAAQSAMTDPAWIGPVNPLFAGAADAGGVGGPVLAGMAPDARVAAFMNGFALPLDAWTLAALGFDGATGSGDEAQVVNNSWGFSGLDEDGWDPTSRFAHYLNRNYAPNTLFTAATGNGGSGYATTTAPNGGTIVKVGASTSYGSSIYFEGVSPEQFTYGAVQPWSNRGPAGLGDIDPDLVCVGAWGLGANPLNWYPNGQAAYDLFGGTSMADPVCTGVAALAYEAFFDAHGRWPTWQEGTDLLLNGADDLGYDPLTQGSGNADAARSTAIAAGDVAYVTPSQWTAGDYRGVDYTPAFPAIVHPGDSVAATLTFNSAEGEALATTLSDVTLMQTHEVSFTVTLGAGAGDFTLPDYLQDISALVAAQDPDLIRAHVMFPYSVFDAGQDYFPEHQVAALFYDWSDLNGDGNLWDDANGNGLVEPDEIDVLGPGEYEFNRYTYGYPLANYLVADVGRDALSRGHDGTFFGLQRWAGGSEIDVTVSLIFYKKADWPWLTLSATGVSAPAGGQTTVTATLNVPADARVGIYQATIAYGDQLLPVIVNVAADSTTFEFGATSLDEPLGDLPYDNGHVFGSTNWGWRPETGDGRQFFYDLPAGASGPGKAMIVETEWVYPQPVEEPPPPPPAVFFEGFEAGIPAEWTVIDNGGNCVWSTIDLIGRPNLTGGEGNAAVADSDSCGPGTTMDTDLHTPSIDLSAYEDEVWLAFRTDFRAFLDFDSGAPLQFGAVDISTNGGTDWTTLLTYEFDYRSASQVIDLSDYAGEPDVMLRFHFTAMDWTWWWQVDEVGLYLEDPSDSLVTITPDLTDVDTAIYGAAPDEYSTGDPAFFGPSGVERRGGSENLWLGGGTFAFGTATGGPKEVVGGSISDGLGYISLHNVLNAGRIVGEPVVGSAYQLTVAPAPLEGVADTLVDDSPPMVGEEWQVTVTSTAAIEEGIAATGVGLYQPVALTGEQVQQDNPDNICTASWVYALPVQDGAFIEAATTSDEPNLDIDLYLAVDGGDGAFTCFDDSLLAGSATFTAEEFIRFTDPPDGLYWVIVHGWDVPNPPAGFDITIDAVQGDDLVIENVPDGPVAANTPVTFDVSTAVPYEPGTLWKGLLFIGPADAPTALSLPVTLTVPELGAGELDARFSAAPEALTTGDETTFTLWIWNYGADAELVDAVVEVPAGLVVMPGSVSATQGDAFYSIVEKTITWSGGLAGNSGATITFDATAASLTGMVEAEAQVTGQLRETELHLTAPVWINVAPPPRITWLPVAAGE